MVEPAQRNRVDSGGRNNPTPQWEVFCREEPSEPLSHVGSVAAESDTEAYEHASRLFDRYATDLWICPAEEVTRYSTRGLEAGGEEVATDGGDPVSDAAEETPEVTDS